MKTLPENWSPGIKAALHGLNAGWLEKRATWLECLHGAYDVFANELEKAGLTPTATDREERIPAQVFEAARHFGWIADPTKRSVKRVRLQPNSSIPGATTNYPVTEPIPDAELVENIGRFKMTARFKTQFLDGWLAGRRSYWRGKMYAQAQDTTAAAEVGAPEAGKPDESVLGRDVERLKLPNESRKAKKRVRRNKKYEEIDKALCAISGALPNSHEDVFRLLDDRKVPIPNRQPFKSAGGWLKGFQKNRHSASAWLSQAWRRLGLPAFLRGPKK